MLLRLRRPVNPVFVVVAALLCLRAMALAEDRFQSPLQGEVLAAGTAIEVRWTGRPAATEQELVLSLDGGLTFPIRLSPELSPRAGGYRLIIPNVASPRARLAVRAGSGEQSEEESIRLVSDEFSIVSSGSGDTEELMRGAREWWTRQALLSTSAVDACGERVGSTVQERLPDDWLEVGDPHSIGSPGNDYHGARMPVNPSRPRPAASRASASCLPLALPLRL